MPSIPLAPLQPGQQRRQVLLNLKSLFWCLRQLRHEYNINLVVHSLERRYLHPDIADSHLGDNIAYLMETLDEADLDHIIEALGRLGASQPAVDMGDKHFEIGHYIQAIGEFGAIAEEIYGIITCVTPELRGLFYLEGPHLMESAFAPSDVRVIFGTYIS